MKKLIFACIGVSLAVQAGTEITQPSGDDMSNNPERRGIRLLRDDEIRKLSTPRKHGKPIPLDERKSVFVTDQAILKLFTFDELMERLVRDSGSHTLTKEALFQQWWDTANPKSLFNLPFGGPNCDSGLLNSFPYTCPRDEGQQALFNSFGMPTPATYTAIALSNRFDLATPPEKGGTDCGEYRIVFERNSGATSPLNRNLLIFEAALPNPHPHPQSLGGCRAIQEFWEELSTPGLSVATRGRRLHEFFYRGLPREHVQPVVLAKHYGSATPKVAGQVRTNQFMAGSTPHQPWLLRQFHIVNDAQGMRFVPVAVATNPPAALFDETASQPLGPSFRTDFLDQVASLANADINLISMSVAAKYDAGESVENAPAPSPMDYKTAFASSPAFKAAIQGKIPAGSGLTPEDIVARAQTQSCAGCHHLSVNAALGGGLTWPSTLPPTFTHEQLANPESGPDGPRYLISDALKNVFLPFRKHVIETFLQGP
jgi:hypothetical protein